MTSLRLRGRKHGRTKTFSSERAWTRWLALSCAGIALLGVSLQLVAPRAVADGRPPGGRFDDPVVRAVDIAQPSIVRLATLYTAHITLTLCGQEVTLPAGGEGYTLGATGSGAFISANGDILTADHVVDVPKDLLDQAIFQEQASATDIANLLTTNPGCHASQAISADDVAAGYVQYAGIPYVVRYSSPRRLVWQSTAFTGPVSNTSQKSILEGLLAAPYHDATVLSASSVNDNDLAIVHVDLTDTPNIQLDNSASVATDDQLTIIGYPGNGDVTNDGTDLLTPSVNVTTISAVKSGDNGAQLIQVGGNVEHGDSGGPALDAQGRIVGVVSFGFVGPNSPGSTAFLRSSNSVRSLISAAGITTTPGAFEKAWEAAFADYAATYAGHWHAAARKLDDLNSRYPTFKGVQPYMNYADQAANVEAAPPDSTQILEIVGGAAALLALIVVGLTLLVIRGRNRKRRPAYASGAQAFPYGGTYPYGYPPAPYGPPSQQFGSYAPPGAYGMMTGLPGPLPASPNGQESGANSGVFAYSMPQAAPPSTAAYGSYPGNQQDAPLGRMPSDLFDAPRSGADAPREQVSAPAANQNGYDGYARMASADQMRASGDGAAERQWTATSFGASGYGVSPASAHGYCGNGHPMPPGEQYCAHCGAPRWAGSRPSGEGYPGAR